VANNSIAGLGRRGEPGDVDGSGGDRLHSDIQWRRTWSYSEDTISI